jgi:hypothetical protein
LTAARTLGRYRCGQPPQERPACLLGACPQRCLAAFAASRFDFVSCFVSRSPETRGAQERAFARTNSERSRLRRRSEGVRGPQAAARRTPRQCDWLPRLRRGSQYARTGLNCRPLPCQSRRDRHSSPQETTLRKLGDAPSESRPRLSRRIRHAIHDVQAGLHHQRSPARAPAVPRRAPVRSQNRAAERCARLRCQTRRSGVRPRRIRQHAGRRDLGRSERASAWHLGRLHPDEPGGGRHREGHLREACAQAVLADAGGGCAPHRSGWR